jgi:hypothetical protein
VVETREDRASSSADWTKNDEGVDKTEEVLNLEAMEFTTDGPATLEERAFLAAVADDASVRVIVLCGDCSAAMEVLEAAVVQETTRATRRRRFS